MARRNGAAPDFIVAINIANAARSGDLRMLKKAGERISRIRRVKIGKVVSDFCDDDGEGPLHYAAQLAHAEICDYLIKTFKMDVNSAAHSGKTPLCFAAKSGDQNTVESLINCGAALNVKDAKGLSPLHDAVIGGLCSL